MGRSVMKQLRKATGQSSKKESHVQEPHRENVLRAVMLMSAFYEVSIMRTCSVQIHASKTLLPITIIPACSGSAGLGPVVTRRKKISLLLPDFRHISAECTGRSATCLVGKPHTPGRPTGHLSSARGNLHTNYVIRIVCLEWQ